MQGEQYPSLSQYTHEMIEIVERATEELLKRQERGAARIRLSEVYGQNNLSDFMVKLFLKCCLTGRNFPGSVWRMMKKRLRQ